jgi:hypothetical protein
MNSSVMLSLGSRSFQSLGLGAGALLALFVLGCSGGTEPSKKNNNGSGGSGGTAAGGSGGSSTGGSSAGGSDTSGGSSAGGSNPTGGSSAGGSGAAGGSGGSGGGELPDVDWSNAPTAPVAQTCAPTPTAAPGAAWDNVTNNLAGEDSECGNLTMLSADPCSNRVIAGVAAVGLFATTDGGDNWVEIAEAAGITNRASSIVYDPEDADRMWESGIYNGPGVYASTDNGATFSALGSVTHNDLVSVDFTDPDRQTLVAGTHEQKQKLFRSTDGGANWTDIGPNLPASAHFSILPQVLDANHFLLGSCGYGDGTCGVYLSNDAGETWGIATTEAAQGRPLWAADGTLLWTLIYNSGVIKSTDSGKTWTKGGGIHTGYIQELPDGRFLGLGDDHVKVSSDGLSWANIGNELPIDDAAGMVYSIPTKTLYIWRWDCGDVVLDDAIWASGWDWE